MIEKTFNQGLDPTKWSDIRKEFFNEAYSASVSGVVPVAGPGVIGAVAAGVMGVIGAGVATVAAFAFGAGVVGARVVGATAVAFGGTPEQERSVAKDFGFASGLVVPIAFAVAVGYSVNKYVESNQIRIENATTSVPANCNRDAVAQEIKKLETHGFKITLECLKP